AASSGTLCLCRVAMKQLLGCSLHLPSMAWQLLCIAVLGLSVAMPPVRSMGDPNTVLLTNGLVNGIKERSLNGNRFYSFYGIPYAEPPLGEMRFKEPVPSKGWKGTRDGSQQQERCMQPDTIAYIMGLYNVIGSEDCLYLNAFTPRPNDMRATMPVLVFFHGGGYGAGAASEYHPYAFMNQDVVLIVIQYRLGLFGFLSTEDRFAPGNAGLRDQTLALKYIEENAHVFGGDPFRVTLIGESAGAAAAHLHLFSPYSQGVFQQLILESGSALVPWAVGGSHLALAQATAEEHGCPTTDEDMPPEWANGEMVLCLQMIDAKALTMGLKHGMVWAFFPILFGPRIDGDWLPDYPEVLLKEGKHHNVDILSGIMKNDGALFTNFIYGILPMKQKLESNFGYYGPGSLELDTRRDDMEDPETLARYIYDHFIGEPDFSPDNADKLTQLYSERQFFVGHDLSAIYHTRNFANEQNKKDEEKKSGRDPPENIPIARAIKASEKQLKKVYLYELNHRAGHSLGDHFQIFRDGVGDEWVTHADIHYYFFTGGKFWLPFDEPDDQELQRCMLRWWSNFASTGNPNLHQDQYGRITTDTELPVTWLPATPDNLQHLALQVDPEMVPDSRQEDRKFWYSLPTRQNHILHPELVKPLRDNKSHTRDEI
ncbi:unnamed protein product, partial [Meganyctiphanes norvegica]